VCTLTRKADFFSTDFFIGARDLYKCSADIIACKKPCIILMFTSPLSTADNFEHDACLLELQNYYEAKLAKLAILQEFFSRKLEIP